MPFTPYFVNGFVQISAVLQTTPGYVIDGARFYQFPFAEYSISQEKALFPALRLCGKEIVARTTERRRDGLTLAVVQGIIR